MKSLFQEIRYALRVLGRNRGFAFTAAGTLAVGIGATTAIFGVLDAVVFRPLPFGDSDRLVAISNRTADFGEGRAFSPAEFADIARDARAFEQVAAFHDQAVNLTGRGEPERLTAYTVSPNLPRLLRVRPILGQVFDQNAGRFGAPRVALIGFDLWRTRFRSDPGVVGQAIQLDGVPVTVVGVLPRGIRFPEAGTFHFRRPAQLWMPVAWQEVRQSRGDQYLCIVGRLAASVSPEAMKDDLDRISRQWRAAYAHRYGGRLGFRLVGVPLSELYVAKVRASLVAVAFGVWLLLAIACADVANLMLARAAARRREFAIRVALGARGGRLIGQLVTESLLLAFAGGTAGLVLSVWAVRMLVHYGPADMPRLADAAVGPRVLLFTAIVCAAAGALFGLAPARQSLSSQAADDLKGVSTDLPTSPARRLRDAIVVVQMALALIVSVAAGLLVASFARLVKVDPGFRPGGVLTFSLALPGGKYADVKQADLFYQRLLERLAALPGVRSAAAADPLPFSGENWSGSYGVAGMTTAPGDPEPHAAFAAVTPDYFRAMSIPIRAGRPFAAAERLDTPDVVVVDERLARQMWPGEEAVGKRLLLGRRTLTIVGVVGHVRYAALEAEGEPQIYLPALQWPRRNMTVVVAGLGDPSGLVGSAGAAVRELDHELPIASMRSMDDLLAAATARPRFQLFLMGLFSIAGVLLAAVGLGGILTQMVASRAREIGIRMAIGAQPRDVLALVLRRGLFLTTAGLVAGLAASLAATRILRRVLFEVAPTDAPTYARAVLLLFAVAGLASLLPAWRASRVDPNVVLRGQ